MRSAKISLFQFFGTAGGVIGKLSVLVSAFTESVSQSVISVSVSAFSMSVSLSLISVLVSAFSE